MILDIIQYPDRRLKIPGRKVEVVDDAIKKIVSDMFDTHYAQENCAALAATQLDFNQDEKNPAYRITVIDFSENKDQPLCLINPEIIERDGETNTEEGCMSVYNVSAKVARAASIKLTYLDQQGEKQSMYADGFMAKCIQHELDHLDGLVFLDRLPMIKQKMIRKKFKPKPRDRK
ncbi:MAG: peptide deformylase [Pseudomonadota bacterium]|nr:peptide deformylase [Pseudomonadota bacterium]MEC8978266.1 peptide deformylase [Pseudomonadota bacterium]